MYFIESEDFDIWTLLTFSVLFLRQKSFECDTKTSFRDICKDLSNRFSHDIPVSSDL